MLTTINQGAALVRLPTFTEEIVMARNTPPKDEKPAGLSSEVLSAPAANPAEQSASTASVDSVDTQKLDAEKAKENTPATEHFPPADPPPAEEKGSDSPEIKQGVIRPDQMRKTRRVHVPGLRGSFADTTFDDNCIAEVSKATYDLLNQQFGEAVNFVD